ncbi:MAG: hypothetical protein JNJ46_28860 [Myxococcales bacterium]|nr:hypothetical protein [Myxococcales bacterium]
MAADTRGALRPLNYFSSPQFVRSDLKAGVLRSRGGTRLIGISEDFLRGFVVACEHETGPATSLVLRRCGRFFGARLARRCEDEISSYLGRSLRDGTMSEFEVVLQDLWTACGMGELRIDWSRGQFGFLSAKLVNSPMQDIGPKGHVADDMFEGVIEGFIDHFAGDDFTCIQTGDVRLGDREGTTFVLVPRDWVSRVRTLLAGKTAHSQLVAQLSGA